MGDIDFDELDKAVNSLMNKADTENPDAINPVPTPQPQSTDLGSVSRSAAEDMTVPERSAAGPAPIVGRRSSGRFMDVIPAGGAARAATPRPAPSATASREASGLEPVTEPDAPSDSQALRTEEIVANDDSLSFQSEVVQAPGMESLGSDAPESTLLTSPFLEGVEIDKRPLGGPAVTTQLTDEDLSNSEAESLAMPDPIDFADEPLPSADATASDPWGGEAEADSAVAEDVLQPELSPEVLAVETMPLDAPGSKEQPAAIQSVADAREESAEPVKRLEVDSTPAPAAPLTSGDIKPQYASVPADAPEPSAVFEAASESPQALSHPEKKKSGWSVVLWILLMVVIGVAGGVAVWYFLVR